MVNAAGSGLTRALVDELRRLRGEKRSGTLYFASMNRRLVQVGLEQGEIVSLSFQNEHGPQALDLLLKAEVEAGVSRFADGPPRGARLPLPATPQILAQLEARPAPASATGTPAAPRLDREARMAIEEELTELIGPIAGLLCKDIWNTVTTVDAAVAALGRELPDPGQAERLRERVLRRLG